MRRVRLDGPTRSLVLENHVTRMPAGLLAPGFCAELMRKGLRPAQTAARGHGVFASATALAAQMLETLVTGGRGAQEAAAAGVLVAELSGLGDTKGTA